MIPTNLTNTFVGLGLRELGETELVEYCQNETSESLKSPPLTDKLNFTRDFGIRVFTSGCYYLDTSTGNWTSDGTHVLSDTNYTHTHCSSSHLTDFAGGFLVVPNEINFESVFANASFDQNMTIYLTVIIVTCLYILFAVWCRFMDIKDTNKTKIHILEDNKSHDTYLYEITVHTGSRRNAGTDSKVSFILNGYLADSDKRQFSTHLTNTKLFRRGAIDTFIMAMNR
jgi:polycystin 1L2